MEEWIEIIKERLLEVETPLPPDDWERFEAMFLSHRRRRRMLSLTITLLTSAAVAAFAIFVINRETGGSIIEQAVTPTSSPVILSSDVLVTSSEDSPVNQPTHITNHIIQTKTVELTDATSAISNPDSTEIEREGYIAETKSERQEHYDENCFNFGSSDNIFIRRASVAPHINGLRNDLSVDNTNIGLGQPGNIQTPLPAPGTGKNANHSIPLTFGLDFSFMVSERLAITSGLEFSSYKSRFTLPIDEIKKESQTANYLGIPLKLEWIAFKEGRFSTWVGAGGKVDRCVFARYDGKTIKDNSFNWSVMADAGVQYNISDKLGVFITPELSWYFKPENPALLTYRTENPLMFTVGAGFRFSL